MSDPKVDQRLRKIARSSKSEMEALRRAYDEGYSAGHEQQMQMRIRDEQERRRG